MADARPRLCSIVFAAGCWFTLTTACEQRAAAPAAPTAEKLLRARPTTVGDARSLMRALKPRMDHPSGGWRADEDGHGNLVIRTRGVLQNVMVAGRGPDGGVVTGCVSSPEQVEGVLGGGNQNAGH